MDVITHNGVSYKKATAVAKEFGYTTDYIGQLCRAKKVDARLVGRAWYVNVADLEEHKRNRYKTDFLAKVEAKDPLHGLRTPTTEVTATEESTAVRRPVAVPPPLKNKTVKMASHFKAESLRVPVSYVSDEQDLLPRVRKDSGVATRIPVMSAEPIAPQPQRKPEPIPEPEPVEAVRVRITKRRQTKPTLLKAEAPPEIVLKGDITVQAAEESTVPLPAEVPMTEKESKDSPTVTTPAAAVTKVAPVSPAKRDNHKNKDILRVQGSKISGQKLPVRGEQAAVRRPGVAHEGSSQTSFTPKLVSAAPTAKRRARSAVRSKSKGSILYLILLLMVVFGFFAFLILTLESELLIEPAETTETWSLDVERWR